MMARDSKALAPQSSGLRLFAAVEVVTPDVTLMKAQRCSPGKPWGSARFDKKFIE